MMVLWGYEICRRDIPKYLTPRLRSRVHIWENYRRFGLPFAGGWAEQPAVVMDVIELLEDELAKRKAQRGGK
jgi:hypothetical protein